MANQRKRLTTNQRLRICYEREKERNPAFTMAIMARTLGVSHATVLSWFCNPATCKVYSVAAEPAARLAQALWPDPLRASRYSATVILREWRDHWRVDYDFKPLPRDYSYRHADHWELR